MPWEMREEDEPPTWHDHALLKYKTRRMLALEGTAMEGLVAREQWGAAEPTSRSKLTHSAPFFYNLPDPQEANHVHFTHTNTADCHDQESCSRILRDLQEQQMRGGEPDIIWSFMVGGDGKVYEGRGWNTLVPVPDDFTHFRTCSLFVAAIGDYSKMEPPKEILDAMKTMITWGIMNKEITCCYDKSYDYELKNMYLGKCRYY